MPSTRSAVVVFDEHVEEGGVIYCTSGVPLSLCVKAFDLFTVEVCKLLAMLVLRALVALKLYAQMAIKFSIKRNSRSNKFFG